MRHRRAKSLERFKHRRKVGVHPSGVFGAGDACYPYDLQFRVLRQDICVRWFHEQHRRNPSETQDLHRSGGAREVIAIAGEIRRHWLISIRVQRGSQCRVVIGIGLPHRHDACGNPPGCATTPPPAVTRKSGEPAAFSVAAACRSVWPEENTGTARIAVV